MSVKVMSSVSPLRVALTVFGSESGASADSFVVRAGDTSLAEAYGSGDSSGEAEQPAKTRRAAAARVILR